VHISRALAGEADMPKEGEARIEDDMIRSDGCSGMTSGDHLMQQTNGQQKMRKVKKLPRTGDRSPHAKEMLSQLSQLFHCFSTFSALSNPPTPFSFCLKIIRNIIRLH
jgi:hypothetical protein